MHFTSEQRLDDILEREFTLCEISGILWTPRPASAPAPLMLVGHPGGTAMTYPQPVARARHATAEGLAVVKPRINRLWTCSTPSAQGENAVRQYGRAHRRPRLPFARYLKQGRTPLTGDRHPPVFDGRTYSYSQPPPGRRYSSGLPGSRAVNATSMVPRSVSGTRSRGDCLFAC